MSALTPGAVTPFPPAAHRPTNVELLRVEAVLLETCAAGEPDLQPWEPTR